MLEFLRRQFSAASEEEAWSGEVIAHTWWPRCARRIFKLAPKAEQSLHSQILLAAAHPDKNW
jgi:hypothetical protein